MKTIQILLLMHASMLGAFADGEIIFNNRVAPDIDAPFLRLDGSGLGMGYWAQLVMVQNGSMTPLYPITNFRTNPPAAAPYVNQVSVTVPGVESGQQVTLRMRAWKGPDYESAECKAESGEFTITVGGGVMPPTNLEGLQGAQMTKDCDIVPGELRFQTYVPRSVDAPFKKFDGTGLGAGYTAALFLVQEDRLELLSPTTTFDTRSPLTSSYVNPVEVIIPGTVSGQTVTLRMRAWKGAVFEAAECKIESADFAVTLGGGTRPAATLNSLKGMTMVADCEAPPVVKGTPLFSNLKSFVTRLPAGDPEVPATLSLEGPKDIVMTDLNGDGLADIALSNVDGTVTVYFALGNGHFTPAMHLHTGASELRGIIAADFNGDGLPELATAAPYDGVVFIFINQGRGVFSAPTELTAWAGARNLVAGDFDADGHQDLVVAGPTVGLRQYRGLGDGTFEEETTLDALNVTTDSWSFPKPVFSLKTYRALGASTDQLLVTHAMTNQLWRLVPGVDGKLVISGSITNEISNDIDGTYSIDAGPIVSPISTGLPDLVTAHRDRGVVLVHRGDFSGAGFEQTIRQQLDIPGGPRAVQLIDLDKDGWNDLVVVLRNFDRVITYKNVNGTFVGASELPVGASPRELGTGDINRDGYADIAVMNRVTADVTVLPSVGGQPSFVAPEQIYEADGQVSGLALVDFNGDGRPDVVQLHRASGEFSVRVTGQDGSLGAPSYYLAGNVPADQAIVDVNNDGIMDMVTANLGRPGVETGSVSVRLGSADGTLQPEQRFLLPREYAGNLLSLVPADFDGDGKIDLAVGYLDYRIAFFKGNGDGTFTFSREQEFIHEARSLTAGDFDQDGDIDLAGVSYDGSIIIVENEGNLLTTDHLSSRIYPGAAGSYGASVIRSIDYNHDGDIDLLVGSGNGASVYFGGPGMSFSLGVEKLPGTGFAVSSMAQADFDGDGELDLAVACQLLSSVTILTRVNGRYEPAISIAVPSARFVASADLDGDGQPDLVGTGDVLWTALSSRNAAQPRQSMDRQRLPGGARVEARPVINDHLVINEFLAANDTFPMEGDEGRKSDWVELYNPLSVDVNLAGWRFGLITRVQGNDVYQEFHFPSDGLIRARGYLLIYCSGGKRGSMHTDFPIPMEGGTLVLKNPARQIVDRVLYGPQQRNISYARFQDAHPSFVFNPFPNPNRSNRDNGSVDPSIKLEGVYMQSVQPNQPIRFYARGKDDEGIVSLSLVYKRLDRPDDAPRRIVLFDDGLHGDGRMLDGFFSGVLEEGLPSGTEIQFYIEGVDLSDHTVVIPEEPIFAKPGQALRLYSLGIPGSAPAIELSEIVPWNNLGLTDESGGNPDWIEIRNHSATEVSLDGVTLKGGAFDNTEYHFPAGLHLAPGEHKVFYCDGHPEQGPLHTGFRLNREGGYVALLNKSSTGANVLLDAVTYPAIGPDRAYARLGRGGKWASITPTPGTMNVSRHHLVAVDEGDGGISLALAPLTGKQYKIEVSVGLENPVWSEVAAITGDGVEAVVAQPIEGQSRFFRVVEAP